MTEVTEKIEIRRHQGEDEMAQLLRLRHDVFCGEQGVPEREELDGRDGEAVHLVAVEDGRVLATCRLLFVGATVQFSRLAVARDARRRRIATRLLALADEETPRRGGPPPRAPRPDLRPLALRRRRATSRAGGCSWRPASSTWRWRSCSESAAADRERAPDEQVRAGQQRPRTWSIRLRSSAQRTFSL